MGNRFERCQMLFGENFSKIQRAKILILGVGGVGGHALDCLYRSGVSDITIVDFDRYDITNQNRQIGSDAVGVYKVEHLQTRYTGIKVINQKIDIEWVHNTDLNEYDLILDAIDDIKPKVELIKKYYKKMISSGGSAKKTDPTKIEYISLWKTTNDPFLRKIRTMLKKDRFDKNFKVIFSSEVPKVVPKGSFVGVTGAFGLTMCSLAIDKIIKEK
ncbi:MAG: ThiF family adenylyltransferase [Arcobacteraceae bacterium]|nr:ThiF family adenylyltransferase [Arcobacteraceae bacterium]